MRSLSLQVDCCSSHYYIIIIVIIIDKYKIYLVLNIAMQPLFATTLHFSREDNAGINIL